MSEPPSNALARRIAASVGESALLAVRSADGRFVSSSRPDPETADGYLRLTAKLLLRAEKEGFHSIGVISALPGEGKTTAAINLGLCLGRTRGRTGKVLLIDGDSRTQTLTRMLSAGAPAPRADASPDKRGPILHRVFRGGDLLPALPAREGLSLSSPAVWAATLERLKVRYRYIVVDCPSVAKNPEALVLRECVDRLVLVVRTGKTTKRQVEAAVGDCGKRVAGVIVIDAHGPRPLRGRKGGA